jgi:hypothetical protein
MPYSEMMIEGLALDERSPEDGLSFHRQERFFSFERRRKKNQNTEIYPAREGRKVSNDRGLPRKTTGWSKQPSDGAKKPPAE